MDSNTLPTESYPDQNNGISLPSKEAEVKEISDATIDKERMMKLIEEDPKRCYQMLEEKNRWLRGEIDLIKDEFSDRNFDKLLEELELSLWVPTVSYPDKDEGISLPSREAEVKEISDANSNKHESYQDQNEWMSLPSREIEAKEISDAISNKQRMIELIEEDPSTCYQHLLQENMRLSEVLETVRDEFKAHNLHTLLIELELSLHLNDYELPKDCS